MRVPTASELLSAWELGLRQTPIQRALTLLATTCPESADETLWALPIGQRDAQLLELRRRLFGAELSIVTPCPVCGEQLESSFRTDDIQRDAGEAVGVYAINGYRVTLRPPVSRDFIALAPDTSAGEELLKRCIVELYDADGVTSEIASLPDTVNEAIAERIAELDPQADVQLQLSCPACAHQWSAVFDIADFLWKEVHAWAQRTLRDVHRLAHAYGWTEAETLSLSPTRRQIYLELCRQ
jgi:uncharacterized protein (UPF0212 family)